MANISTTGFETTDSTTGWFDTGGGGWLYTTAQANSGSRSLVIGNGNGPSYFYAFVGSHNVTYYERMYVRFGSLTSNTSNLFVLWIDGGSYLVAARYVNGVIKLWDNWMGQDYGPGQAVSANTWYLVELAYKSTPSGANEYSELKVNGSSVGSFNDRDGYHQVPGRAGFYYSTGSATDTYYDDFKLNDSTGASDNTWPGGLSTPATVNATVTDTTVDGQPATVLATTDTIAAVTNTNISITGQPATITATSPNKTITAVVSNVNIAGQATIISSDKNVIVTETVTNITIAAGLHTAGVRKDITNTTDKTGITVDAQPAAVQLAQAGPPVKMRPDGFVGNPGVGPSSGLHGLEAGGLGYDKKPLNEYIDELTPVYFPGNRDFITNGAPSGTVVDSTTVASTIITLSNITHAPYANDNCIIRYVAYQLFQDHSGAVDGTLSINLRNGISGSIIKSITQDDNNYNQAIKEYILTPAEMSNIVSYNDLAFYLEWIGSGQGIILEWLELQVPGEFLGIINPPNTNIGIAGTSASVEIVATPNAIINVPSADIGIIAYVPPTIGNQVNIFALVDNINIEGIFTPISTPVTVVGTADIGVAGKTVSIGANIVSHVSLVETFDDGAMEPWIKQGSYPGVISGGAWKVSTPATATGRLNVTIAPEWVINSPATIKVDFYSNAYSGTTLQRDSLGRTYWASWSGSCVFTVVRPNASPQSVTRIDTGPYTYTDTVTNFGSLTIEILSTFSGAISGTTVGEVRQVTITTDTNIQVFHLSTSADIADSISVQGIATNLAKETQSTVTDIKVRANHPTITIPGSSYIGANVAEISIESKDVGIDSAIEFSHATIPTNIRLNWTTAKIRTMDDSFIFIAADDAALTAFDAQQIEGFDFGGFLYNQVVTKAFKIGNIGDHKITLDLSVQSVNTEIIPLVEFSSDKVNYSPTITVGNLNPNAITDPIWVRMNAGSAAPGKGTFLIDVEQSNA